MGFIDLAQIPRISLAQLPSPLGPLAPAPRVRHTETLDGDLVEVILDGRLWIKRDDLTGIGLSGNKVRKLEFLIADAQARGADVMVTCGAVQSNCARAMAVAAAMTGFDATLVLTGPPPMECDGNLLIDRLVGSETVLVGDVSAADRDAALTDVTARLRRGGRSPYLVPFGGSSAVGALGYVLAAYEIAEQLADRRIRIRHVVLPMASGGTYAGLYVGFQLAGVPIRPIGAFVEGSAPDWTPRLLDLIHHTAGRLGVVVDAEPADIHLIDARGAGYGQPTDPELDFIVRIARRTGLLLDPVYTGKALFALARYLRCGAISAEEGVMFLHTGGAWGLFPHRGALQRRMDAMDLDRPTLAADRAPAASSPFMPAGQRISIASP